MEEDEQFTKLSIEDRCVHKSWKARVSGYEAAAKLFRTIDDEKSPEWNKYLGLVKKFVVDSNAPAQEKGLDAVFAFVENCHSAGKTVNDVMGGLLQKCIAAPKARTKELGAQICLMYIEIEKHEIVLEELLKGTESKNPKISAACIHIITDALREFGPKVINVNKLIKRSIVLLEDRDKGVRDETKLLLVEVHRWLGSALEPQLSSLKPAQLTEMQAEFNKKGDSQPRPTRFLRSQQAKQAQKAVEEEQRADECDGEDARGEEIDPFDLIDPVDILNNLPKGFYTQLEAKKWSERKDALEALEKSLNDAAKIENGDYGDLIRALKKIIQKDSNVVVVCIAIKCVTGIAKGLKKRFHPYAVVTLQALFEKFKEKKQNVVSALREAVDAVYVSITVESILDDVIANLDNKNPSIKSEVAGFLARCFTTATPAILNKKHVKIPLTQALLKCLVDQDPTVRENAALALGTAMKVVGEKSLASLLTDVDNQKMAKINEYCEKAVILVKASKPAKAKEPSPAPVPEKTSGVKVVKPKGAQAVIKKKATPGGGLASNEAISKAKSLLPENILNKLDGKDDSAWTEYLKLVEQLDVSDESGEITFAVAISVSSAGASSDVLAIKMNVLKAIMNKMSVSKSTLFNAIPDVLCALTNKDCSESASAVLNIFATMTSVDQVVQSALTNEDVLNNPKLWAEALNWTTSQIMKSGVIGDAAFLEECGKNALHQCDLVRNAGLALIGTLHLPPRGSDSSSARREKAVLRSSSAPKVNETLKTERVVEESSSEKEAAPKAQNEPRVDIGNQITPQILKDLADKNWKVRAEVVTKLQGMVNSAQNITGNLGDAPPLIAARIKDGNGSIATSAIALVESLSKAMGPLGKPHVKVFLPPLLKSIGDSKTWIKTPALSCVNTIGETSGYKEFFENEMIADALKTGSPATRAELWIWLAEKLPNIPVKTIQKEELIACLPTLFNNLEDRNPEVRKGANDANLGFMIHLGYKTMHDSCESIVKGSNVAAIKAILEKTRGLLPEKPVTKSKSQPIIEKGSKSATAKMAPGSSATITKPKVKPGSAPPSRTTGRKKEEDVDASALLKTNSLKHQRVIDEQKQKVMKWNFNTPRQEYVDLLSDQMTAANCNKNLISNMFHVDFKYHLKAIDSLMDELPSNIPGLISNLDLVLRWMTLRFFDTNPSVITRGLDYLCAAFTALKNDNYIMLDSEASSFLPYLILKGGDPKDIVQQKVKELFEQLKEIYPVGKLVQFVMEGTKSKNSRQRAACLDVLNNYVDHYGVSVCNPSQNVFVKDIVKHFTDRDSAVRSSVMKLAVSMYSYEGERFLQLLNQYIEKDGQLIEDRIRKQAKNRPVASVKPMSRDNVELVEEETTGVDEYTEQEETYEPPSEQFNTPLPPTPPRTTVIRNTNTSLSSANYVFDERVIEEIESVAMPTHQALIPPKLTDIDLHFLNEGSVQASIKPIQMPKMTPTLSTFAQPTAIKWELAQIASSDIEKAMNSMSQIDTVLNSEKRFHLIKFVDYMVQQLVHQLLILNQSHHPEVVNCYRANFAMLTKVCSYPELCMEITELTLYKVLEQLLSLLAESKLETLDRQDMFRRVVNNIVLKLLENANKTYLICALINMLGETMDIPLATGHYNDLCIRCLWKLNRAQPKWDKELNYTRILQEYQKFLKDYPSAWWKSQEIDVPLRTVKTMLHTMVKLRGTEVRDCISNDPSIPDDSELSLYVRKLVKHLKVEDVKDEGEKHKTDKPVSIPRLSKEHSNELSEIFKMIGDTAGTSEGLKRLHSFIKTHPEADIQPFVAKASPVFQNYIRRGLHDLDEQLKKKLNLTSTINGPTKNEEDGDDSHLTDEKKKFDTDAERLWNRLTALQEKAGCHDTPKKLEKVDISKDSEILKEDPRPNAELETIRERYARIKSHMFK